MKNKNSKKITFYIVIIFISMLPLKGLWDLLSVYYLKNKVGYCEIKSISESKICYECFMGGKVESSSINKMDEEGIKHIEPNNLYLLIYNPLTYEYSIFWFCSVESKEVVNNMSIEVARSCIDMRYFLSPD